MCDVSTTTPDPLVIAHRARCSPSAAENDLTGAAAAIDLGCDGIEVDVRCTRDGHLVLMHDLTPARTAYGDDDCLRRPVEDSTLADLSRLHLRGAAGAAPPALADVLALACGRGLHVVADVKRSSRPSAVWEALARCLAAVPEETRDLLIVQSAQVAQLTWLREAVPSVVTSTISWLPGSGSPGDEPGAVSRAWWTVTSRSTRRDHASGRRVLAWTPNTPEQVDWLVRRGVDGIITDRPGVLLELLGRTHAGAVRTGAFGGHLEVPA